MNFLSLQSNFVKSPHTGSFLLSTTSATDTASPLKTTAYLDNGSRITENNNVQKRTLLQQVWSKEKFNVDKVTERAATATFNNLKMSWTEKHPASTQPEEVQPHQSVEETAKPNKESEADQSDTKDETPSHHARRPPNAFLIFCKKHRPIVRERFPNLENRGVTKILGEWWALLNNPEKQPYNDLAKEYKDAFLSANPNFRWYKLPAPPLRTLSARPPAIPKPTTSTTASSPVADAVAPASVCAPAAEFTPGKLADESQLGGLTSLMNNNSTRKECCAPERHPLDVQVRQETSPVANVEVTTPPKPIKKRFSDYFMENKQCIRNLGLQDMQIRDDEDERVIEGNLTNQDLMNKVVDGMFTHNQEDPSDRNNVKEVRKSERMCKGKRYEMFMVEGKLLGNRRDTKFVQKHRIDSKLDQELNIVNIKPETPKLDLGNTIKRLAERTNVKLDLIDGRIDNTSNVNNADCLSQFNNLSHPNRVRSISETSEGSNNNNNNNKSSPPNFNLDLRISHLPCLSYDEFLHRKRESKKRKIRSKTDSDARHKLPKLETQPVVGSKKRKNKQSITHLGGKSDGETGLTGDLLGLATLAEVAANTEKINDISE